MPGSRVTNLPLLIAGDIDDNDLLVVFDRSGDRTAAMQKFDLAEAFRDIVLTDLFTGNGAMLVFALTGGILPGANAEVTLDGVMQVPGLDYTVSGNALHFVEAPPAGTQIFARYRGPS